MNKLHTPLPILPSIPHPVAQALEYSWEKNTSFFTLIREIRALNLLPNTKISISCAYFSAVEFEADCFQQSRPEATACYPST
ncbi:MAG: hypothetical protein QOI97_5245 [Pseudomonas sp.]|jgi:hypothetical protein|nr:hypothetical protein [Pseudomonas sp.]